MNNISRISLQFDREQLSLFCCQNVIPWMEICQDFTRSTHGAERVKQSARGQRCEKRLEWSVDQLRLIDRDQVGYGTMLKCLVQLVWTSNDLRSNQALSKTNETSETLGLMRQGSLRRERVLFFVRSLLVYIGLWYGCDCGTLDAVKSADEKRPSFHKFKSTRISKVYTFS